MVYKRDRNIFFILIRKNRFNNWSSFFFILLLMTLINFFLKKGREREIIKSNGKRKESFGVLQLIGEPIEAFVETVPGSGARGLDVPIALTERVQTQLVCDLGCVHRLGKILLVGEDEEDGVPEFVLVQHPVELFLGLAHSLSVVAIHHEDQPLRVLEVVPPEWSDLVLTADVPDGEGNVFVLDGFDVEADGRDGGHDLSEFQLVENRRLTSRVQSHHQNTHLLLPE